MNAILSYLKDRWTKEKTSRAIGIALSIAGAFGYLAGPEIAAIQTIAAALGIDLGNASGIAALAGALSILLPTSKLKPGKLNMWAVATLIAGLYVVGALVAGVAQAADTIDREYQAVERAGAVLRELVPGCAGHRVINVVKGYQVGSAVSTYNGQKVVTVAGYQLRVACTAYAPGSPDVGGIVAPPPLPPGTVQLTWTPPTTKADGSALDSGSIAGYRILSGTTATALTEKTKVPPGVSATITGFAPGTHYFALRTIDTAGLESTQSAVISVVVK